jgi:glycosyltransferase involved in cell wall biosynthesis
VLYSFEPAEIAGVDTVIVPALTGTKLDYLLRRPWVLRQIREQAPDFIHAHRISSYGLVASYAARRAGLPFLLSVWGEDIFSFPRKSILHRRLTARVLASATQILSTSRIMARETERYLTPKRPIEVTPFGVDTERFRPRAATAGRRAAARDGGGTPGAAQAGEGRGGTAGAGEVQAQQAGGAQADQADAEANAPGGAEAGFTAGERAEPGPDQTAGERAEPGTDQPAGGARPWSGRGLTIGTVKKLRSRYGVDVLIRAFARARELLSGEPSLALEIVGEGPDRERLAELASDLGVAAATTFRGRIPHEEVPAALSGFDIFAALSVTDDESFGVAMLEASAVALPVVATTVGGIPEVVDHERTGFLVPPHDAEAAARCFVELARDEKRRRHMGEAGRRFVEERYSWRACAEQMKGIYERMAAS